GGRGRGSRSPTTTRPTRCISSSADAGETSPETGIGAASAAWAAVLAGRLDVVRSFVEQGARGRVRPLAGVLLFATLAGGCASLSHQRVTFLRQGQLLLGSRDAPPPENGSRWLSVEPPDVGTIARRRLGTAGWEPS